MSNKFKLSAHRKFFILALIALAIPLTVGLVMVSQEIRSRAGGLPMSFVGINPGIIQANILSGNTPIALSALAYDTQGSPINSGVNYSWSISSTNTVGTLTKTQGVISEFVPLNYGCGMLTVAATYGGETMTKSAVIQIKRDLDVPNCGTPTLVPFRIVGKHVDTNGNPLTLNGQSVTLTNLETNISETKTDSPNWSFENLPRTGYQITANPIPGYQIEHMVCYGCIDQDRLFSSNTFSLAMTNSAYVGVTFKYSQQPTPNSTILRFNEVKLHGIGTGGDNVNPNLGGNQNPLTTSRPIIAELYDSSGNLVASTAGNITYSSITGYFSGDVVITHSLFPDPYLIKIKSPRYLKKQLPGIININQLNINNMPKVSLVTGDINSDNSLTIKDYNILIDCYSDLLPPKNCSDSSKKASADLTDDGNVNASDYNLFLRELSVVIGN